MIPTEFEQIDTAWLNTTIGGEASGTIVESRWERIAEGVGLMGRLARFHLRWDGGDGPPSVIVKIPSAIEQIVEQAMLFGFYDREISFYRHIGNDASVRVPRCLHVDASPEIVPFVLVLEDLADARIVDQLEGCELDDSLRVIEAAAQLHAPYWDNPALHELTWLPAVDGPLYSAAGPMMLDVAPLFVDKWGDKLPAGSADLALRTAADLNDFQSRAAQGPLTMCHYDLRAENLLFDADGSVCVIDFQLMATQRGPYDLAYFASWSLTAEQRQAQLPTLLDAYREHLGAGGVEIEQQWLEDCFRESVLGTLSMAIMSAVTTEVENERAEQLLDALVVRSFATALELNSADFLPN